MTGPLRERAKRVELRSNEKSEIGSARATAFPQEAAFTALNLKSGAHTVAHPIASAEPLGNLAARSSADARTASSLPDGATRPSEFYPRTFYIPALHGADSTKTARGLCEL